MKGEAQFVAVGLRVHVDIERALRHADLDLRPEVGDAGARRGTGIDVKHVANLFCHVVEIRIIGALMDRVALEWILNIRKERRDRHRDDSEGEIFRKDQRDARFDRHRGIRNAIECDEIHERAKIHAVDRERRKARARAAGRHALARYDAIHEYFGDAADRRNENHADERHEATAGEQKNRVQRRVVRKRERELKRALHAEFRRARDLDAFERVEHDVRHRHRHERPRE